MSVLVVSGFSGAAVGLVHCVGWDCVGVDGETYFAYFDGSADNPDPVDGFVLVDRTGRVCASDEGAPHDSFSRTCVNTLGPQCYAYNPAALTNACTAVGLGGMTVSTPRTAPLCVVGDVCVWPLVHVPGASATLPRPAASGYVEATVACGLGVPCRFVLP